MYVLMMICINDDIIMPLLCSDELSTTQLPQVQLTTSTDPVKRIVDDAG